MSSKARCHCYSPFTGAIRTAPRARQSCVQLGRTSNSLPPWERCLLATSDRSFPALKVTQSWHLCARQREAVAPIPWSGAMQRRFRRTGRHLLRLRAPLMDWTHHLRISLHTPLKGPRGPERWNRALRRLYMLTVRHMGAWALLSGAGDSPVNRAFRISRLSRRGGRASHGNPRHLTTQSCGSNSFG